MSGCLSAFTHVLEVENGVCALFNSLWLRVIFIERKLLPLVRMLMEGRRKEDALAMLGSDLREEGEELLTQMSSQKFLDPGEDEVKLAQIRDMIEHLKISIMYLIVTNNCNLACSYCYLADALCQGDRNNMDVETVRRAIDLFANIVERDRVGEPQIILYGGEPLLNMEAIEFALEYASTKVPNCRFTLNTNGTVMDDGIATLLRDYNVEVGLSIDGPQEIHDKFRVDRGGRGTFSLAIDGYRKLQEYGVDVGISCTITPANVNHLVRVTRWFIEELNSRSLGFNLMIGDIGNQEIADKYSKDAAQAIVECFEVAREAGVHEDRMMRRVSSLSDGEVSLHDCGGCGQQIVVTPDGQVGLCQAFMNTGQNFFPLDAIDDPGNHELWVQWRRRSPFNIPECLNCEALGMCGGGCPYNSLIRHGDIMSPDLVHCAHAKEALRFLLTDLWRITVSSRCSS
jgi:uncharacterized protein